MSSFYDDASLVVIPSGYKTSKVYAEKPTDGSGDLAFTRTGDTATRVNSAGLIEKVRTNINTYSEQLDNAAWTKQSTTVTANATTAPNNTLTADKLIATATTAFHGIFNVNATLSSLHTFSFYAKKAEYNFVTALDQFSGTFLASFNLDTGVVSSGSGASIQSVGNGWYRCAIAFDGAASAVVATLAPSPSSASVNYLGDGTSGIFVWGVQLETGDIATEPILTTTAAVSVGPVANVPRLDYLGSTCGKLLLEPQRTNLMTFSEQIDNAAWLKTNATISANAATSPDGYQNADKLIDNATLAGHFIQQTISITGVHTFSVFAKASESSVITLQIQQVSVTSNFALIYYDLISGQVESGEFSTSLSAGTIQEMSNGWYRCTITYTPITAGNHNVRVFVAKNIGGNKVDYAGNGTDGVFLYGTQLEAGAYATSYIPTLGASATRGADACSKTGISSLIGQTEGTLFVDFTINALANFGTPISVNDGSTSNYIWLTIFSNGNLRAELNNGTVQAAITYGGAVVGGRYKMAFGYKTNDFALYVNGTQVGTDNSGTTFSGTTLSRVDTDITNASVYSTASESINQALLFKTRLTNAEMASLTSL
jgi:hypothetical protein